MMPRRIFQARGRSPQSSNGSIWKDCVRESYVTPNYDRSSAWTISNNLLPYFRFAVVIVSFAIAHTKESITAKEIITYHINTSRHTISQHYQNIMDSITPPMGPVTTLVLAFMVISLICKVAREKIELFLHSNIKYQN